MRLGLLLVVAACASKPARKPGAQVPPKPAPPSATCEDVGIILRGDIAGYDDDAGRDKERVIATACRKDEWSRAVIDCVAGTPHPQDCLDRLEDSQLAAFEKRLEDWRGQHDIGADPFPAPPLIECADVTADVTKYAPPIGDSDDERGWHIDTRKHFLAEECEHGWPEELKECLLVAGPDATGIEDCLSVDPAQHDEIKQKLTELDRVVRQLAKTQLKPSSITCKQVVARHYADAVWKQKLDGFKPAERKRMIADSRALMANACTKEKWSTTTRACVVAGGGDWCWNQLDKARWGTPAIGTVTSVGIAECDDYSAAVMRFAKCSNLSDQSRAAITRSQQQLLAQIARLPAAERAKMGTSCKAGMEAVEGTLSNSGC